MYLLDTNVVSELRKAKAGRADVHVVAWARPIAAVHLYLSAISVLELERGVLAKLRQDTRQGRALQAWLHGQVLPAFQDRILPVDADVALISAGLHIPNPRPERDTLIAATALHHRLTVVTRNMRDMQIPGLKVIDPWLPG